MKMMVSVPLYFQVTERTSSTVAGAHLMPAVIGNTVGSLLTGAWIGRLAALNRDNQCPQSTNTI